MEGKNEKSDNIFASCGNASDGAHRLRRRKRDCHREADKHGHGDGEAGDDAFAERDRHAEDDGNRRADRRSAAIIFETVKELPGHTEKNRGQKSAVFLRDDDLLYQKIAAADDI